MSTYVNGTTNNSAASSNSAASVVLPSGIQDGDEIVVAFSDSNGGGVSAAPTGYLLVTSVTSGGVEQLYVYRKLAVSGDSSATVSLTWGSNGRWASLSRVYRGGHVDASATNSGTGSNPTCGSFTAAGPSGFSVAVGSGRGAADGSTITFTAPSGYANSQTDTTNATAANRNNGIGGADKALVSTSVSSASFSASQSLSYVTVCLSIVDNQPPPPRVVAQTGGYF